MHPMGDGVSWGFSFRLTGSGGQIWFDRVLPGASCTQIAALTYYSQIERDGVNHSSLFHSAQAVLPTGTV